ncbi:MAG: fructose-6-phosphate aldolase [Chitinophagaceae bacterium]
MKFFIDTANLQKIQVAKELGILDGVTTNPTLMKKEAIAKKEIFNHYKIICDIVEQGDVSAEVFSTDLKGMIEEGEYLAKIHPNIVVKIPITKEGLQAIQYFTQQHIRTNCTLVFSAGQALLAAKAGATYVSPFVGRIDDSSWDGMQLVEQIIEIYSMQGFNTKVLVASVRHVQHILKAAAIGAYACTCPLEAILGLLQHPLTDIGLTKFIEDSKEIENSNEK